MLARDHGRAPLAAAAIERAQAQTWPAAVASPDKKSFLLRPSLAERGVRPKGERKTKPARDS